MSTPDAPDDVAQEVQEALDKLVRHMPNTDYLEVLDILIADLEIRREAVTSEIAEEEE